jgi:hypothetical protein
MRCSVISCKVAALAGASAHWLRSIGGPATTVTGVCGTGRSLWVRGSNSFCGPHIATGTTGALVASQTRAAPVLPRMGHSSGSLVVLPSG